MCGSETMRFILKDKPNQDLINPVILDLTSKKGCLPIQDGRLFTKLHYIPHVQRSLKARSKIIAQKWRVCEEVVAG